MKESYFLFAQEARLLRKKSSTLKEQRNFSVMSYIVTEVIPA
jgi:hypothetical protein